MSELGDFLENESKRQKRSAKEMAASMGVPASMLSQLMTDARGSVRPDSVMRIAFGISDDPDVQAKVLEAYFRDLSTARYKPWIKVTATEAAEKSETGYKNDSVQTDPVEHLGNTLRALRLPDAIIRSFADIARAISGRPKFRTVVEDLASFAREDLLKSDDN